MSFDTPDISWFSHTADSRFCFFDRRRKPPRAARTTNPTTEMPTPMPIFAPWESPSFALEVEIEDEVGVEVETVETVDTGRAGGDLSNLSRRLKFS
jgi:hypothetical protein